MKTKLLRGAGLVTAVVAIGLVYVTGSRAQSTANQLKSPLTTNWIGCLVVGKSDSIDQIARGVFPTPIQHVEIGLRNDGVVIWRSAPAK